MTAGRANRACPTNRRGRTEMAAIRDAIIEVLRADHPQTVRQVFYQLVTRGVIEKTEAEYQTTVIRLLTKEIQAKKIRSTGTGSWTRAAECASRKPSMALPTPPDIRRGSIGGARCKPAPPLSVRRPRSDRGNDPAIAGKSAQ